MSSFVRLTWDLQEWRSTVSELMRRTKHKTLPDFVRWRAKILVQDLIKWTPPRGRHPGSWGRGETWPTQKRRGEKWVKKDIYKLFQAIERLKVVSSTTDLKLQRQIKKAMRQRDTGALMGILQRLKVKVDDVLIEPSAAIHKGAKWKRGRVGAGRYIKVIKGAALKKYVAETMKHVGRLKHGWMAAATWLGVKGVPVWVSRHATSPGRIIDRTQSVSPWVTVINDAVAAKDMRTNEIVTPAMKINARKMHKELEQIIAHELRKASARR